MEPLAFLPVFRRVFGFLGERSGFLFLFICPAFATVAVDSLPDFVIMAFGKPRPLREAHHVRL